MIPHPDAMAGLNTHATVAELLDPPDQAYVVDAGPGQGSFTARLSKLGYLCLALGIDPDQFGVEIPYVQCDLDDGAPLRDGSTSGIIAIELVEHLEAPLRFFREAARCLRHHGWLIVTTPNILSLSSKLSLVLRDHFVYFGDHEYEANGHISPLSERDIRRIAGRCGLIVEDVTYNLGKLPVPRVRHRYPLWSRRFRNRAFGESLIMKLRKVGPIRESIVRG